MVADSHDATYPDQIPENSHGIQSLVNQIQHRPINIEDQIG